MPKAVKKKDFFLTAILVTDDTQRDTQNRLPGGKDGWGRCITGEEGAACSRVM
jgi:hypothetical protein